MARDPKAPWGRMPECPKCGQKDAPAQCGAARTRNVECWDCARAVTKPPGAADSRPEPAALPKWVPPHTPETQKPLQDTALGYISWCQKCNRRNQPAQPPGRLQRWGCCEPCYQKAHVTPAPVPPDLAAEAEVEAEAGIAAGVPAALPCPVPDPLEVAVGGMLDRLKAETEAPAVTSESGMAQALISADQRQAERDAAALPSAPDPGPMTDPDAPAPGPERVIYCGQCQKVAGMIPAGQLTPEKPRCKRCYALCLVYPSLAELVAQRPELAPPNPDWKPSDGRADPLSRCRSDPPEAFRRGLVLEAAEPEAAPEPRPQSPATVWQVDSYEAQVVLKAQRETTPETTPEARPTQSSEPPPEARPEPGTRKRVAIPGPCLSNCPRYLAQGGAACRDCAYYYPAATIGAWQDDVRVLPPIPPPALPDPRRAPVTLTAPAALMRSAAVEVLPCRPASRVILELEAQVLEDHEGHRQYFLGVAYQNGKPLVLLRGEDGLLALLELADFYALRPGEDRGWVPAFRGAGD